MRGRVNEVGGHKLKYGVASKRSVDGVGVWEGVSGKMVRNVAEKGWEEVSYEGWQSEGLVRTLKSYVGMINLSHISTIYARQRHYCK